MLLVEPVIAVIASWWEGGKPNLTDYLNSPPLLLNRFYDTIGRFLERSPIGNGSRSHSVKNFFWLVTPLSASIQKFNFFETDVSE